MFQKWEREYEYKVIDYLKTNKFPESSMYLNYFYIEQNYFNSQLFFFNLKFSIIHVRIQMIIIMLKL